MLLFPEHWHFGYEQIKTDCQAAEEGQSVLLLCNADVDAIAAARILSYMLRSDGVHYQLLPCTNYTALEKHMRTIQLESVRAVVLFNFGAAKNLNRLFEVHQNLPESTKVYVMDCRRPVHLANVHAGDNVVVFMDGTQTPDQLPSDGDNLSGNESSSDEDESDQSSDGGDDESEEESEEEAAFDDVVDGTKQKFTNEKNFEQQVDYDGADEEVGDRSRQETNATTVDDDNDSFSVVNRSKRQRTEESQDDGETDVEHSDPDSPHPEGEISPRELHRQRRERLRSYYSSGSFYGSPAAFIAYQIAQQLRFGEQGDLLWLACVGVTDAYLHARVDMIGYAEMAMGLRQSCLKLFPTDMYERAISTVYAEDLSGKVGGDRTKITFSDNGRIVAEKDYRFFLLRHSSLLDSMIHSDFVSTKLQVWTKKGMHNLQELLAKMGYPLEECKQPFAFMKPNLRRRLHEKIMEYSEVSKLQEIRSDSSERWLISYFVLISQEYELNNFEFTSFFRVTGYQSLLSASDTSYAVTALLECDTPTAIVPSGREVDEDRAMAEAFNIAYDALNPNVAPSIGLNGLANEGHDAASLVNGGGLSGNTGIGAGIRLAMAMQRNIISTAVSLVDRNAINRLRHFRYAYLTCTSAGENQTTRSEMIRTKVSGQKDNTPTHLFSKPLALTRLAQYLMAMHRENGKWTGNKSRPLVLMAEKPQAGTYMVVGYDFPERAAMLTRNKFGMNFELTAKSMNGNFRFDSFDSNVVEVDGGDVQRFIEQLHYLMDSI